MYANIERVCEGAKEKERVLPDIYRVNPVFNAYSG